VITSGDEIVLTRLMKFTPAPFLWTPFPSQLARADGSAEFLGSALDMPSDELVRKMAALDLVMAYRMAAMLRITEPIETPSYGVPLASWRRGSRRLRRRRTAMAAGARTDRVRDRPRCGR